MAQREVFEMAKHVIIAPDNERANTEKQRIDTGAAPTADTSANGTKVVRRIRILALSHESTIIIHFSPATPLGTYVCILHLNLNLTSRIFVAIFVESFSESLVAAFISL